MAFLCKKCKKAFRKDMTVWDEADEFCPHCDNHFVSTTSPFRERYRKERQKEEREEKRKSKILIPCSIMRVVIRS